MDYIQFTSEVIISVVKHGWSATTLIIFIFALFKFAPFRRFVMRHLPRKLKMLDNRMDNMDVRMKRMESKIDALARHMEVPEWDALYVQISKSPSVMDGQESSLLRTCKALLHAITIGAFTMLTGRLFRFKTRGESIQMKKKLLSRKFLMSLISAILVICNDGLNLGLDQNTIIAFGSIVVGYVVGEAATDVAKAKNTSNISDVEKSYHGQ